MANGKPARLAVLIDAENASARIAEALFTEIAILGEASARRVYGDFSSAQIAGWTKVLARWAIQPQQNFANTKGKNSGDIALVIDAWTFCIRAGSTGSVWCRRIPTSPA